MELQKEARDDLECLQREWLIERYEENLKRSTSAGLMCFSAAIQTILGSHRTKDRLRTEDGRYSKKDDENSIPFAVLQNGSLNRFLD